MGTARAVGVLITGLVLGAAGLGLAQDNARPGQLAWIGADANVYVVNEEGAQTALTSDADADGTAVRRYQWPVWSRDGTLGFFAAGFDHETNTLTLEAWVAQPSGAPRRIYQAEDETLTYAAWSPAGCAAGRHCGELAVLIGRRGADTLTVRLLSVEGGAPQDLGQATPFYFDWSPDGAALAWHRSDNRIDRYDLTQSAIIQTVSGEPGRFSAPAWSPAGDALLYTLQDGAPERASLVLDKSGTQQVLVAGLTGMVSFAWSPDGRRIAYREENGPVVVLDVRTNAEVARTPTVDILAFFWSPNGEHLAYVMPDAAPSGSFNAKRVQAQVHNSRLAWALLTVETNTAFRLISFVPTSEQRYLFTYFDQFALSYRVWSPDGTRLAYAEAGTDGEPMVQVLDVDAPLLRAETVGPGRIAVWSYQ